MSERETGSRAGFLAVIAQREGPPPASGPHPPPPAPATVPIIGYRNLRDPEPGDPAAAGAEISPAGSRARPLIDVFATAARAADATVDIVEGHIPAEDLLAFVSRHAISTAVVSDEPEAVAIGDQLASAGVVVARFTPEVAARSDLAVTSATHGLASTGSVVVDSATAGSRSVSLLSAVHWCVLPAERIVASHAEVLRDQPSPMPSCRVVITGPSRTADIEQRLTLGAHGPLALHITVIR